MKNIAKSLLVLASAIAIALPAAAQQSSSSSVRRGARNSKTDASRSTEVTERMQSRMQSAPTSDSELSWMKVIYRNLDLNKEANAPLYFPEMPTNGSENLIRILLRLIADGKLPAYEYLDGRESFDDEHKLKVSEMLDSYHIPYQAAKGSTERNPRFTIDANDVPATEVLSYYIIERWEFDTRTNKMKTIVEAICPVLHRSDDYGMESLKYPMFWVKMDDLRPYLSTQNIFVSDANNLATYTYADYFTLNLYNGDIYKTRNLRNRTMRQLYPNADDLKRANDSIQHELDHFEDKLWVPSLDQLAAQREKREKLEAEKTTGDSVAAEKTTANKRTAATRRGTKKDNTAVKTKRAKSQKSTVKQSNSSSAPRRSVRDRKR